MDTNLELWEDKYGNPLEDGCSVWVELDGGYLLEDIVRFGGPITRFDGRKVFTELEGICRERNSESIVVMSRHVVKKE